jgi:hypothetical protein
MNIIVKTFQLFYEIVRTSRKLDWNVQKKGENRRLSDSTRINVN